MNRKSQIILWIVLIIVLVGILVFVFSDGNIGLRQNNITQNLEKSNKNVIINNTHSILPNLNLAPGEVLTNNLTIICVSGYSATIRDVPQRLREEVFARDNVPYPQPAGTTELDHIIPLCLGGDNSEDNLFVEFAPEYKQKDKLENYLCDHVCSGEIDINYAQNRIARDWYSYYLEVYG